MHSSSIFASFASRLACLLVASMFTGVAAPTEYELKAAYIFNVLRLVQRGAGKNGDAVTLCTYAAGPIESALRALEGSSLQGKKLRVRALTAAKDLRDCDAVFFGRSNGHVPQLLAEAGISRILTIGNDENFLAAGGMISLVVESRRVVVEVNPPAAAAAGWVISSHLLEIARVGKEQKR